MKDRHQPSQIYRIYDGLWGGCQQKLNRFPGLPIQKKQKIRYIEGHMRFGIHEHVPRPCAYVTFLRHPVQRLCSVYFYILTRPNHRLYDAVKSMSFQDFVKSEAAHSLFHTYNNQIQHISGLNESEVSSRSKEALEIANANIEKHFAFVGISELFDESLLLFTRALGWNEPPFYKSRNITNHKSRHVPVSDDTRALIESIHTLDCRFYEQMRSRFHTACASIDGFEEKVDSFKKQNARFQEQNKQYKLTDMLCAGSDVIKNVTRHTIRLKRRLL